MKVKALKLVHFGSYKELEFQFNGQGLTLIQGPTGAGKSTLCDAIPWILFGKTAKGGAVDEIRSWNVTGQTAGSITLESGMVVTRFRAPNDLYYTDDHGIVTRGKDLKDTQDRINEILGFDYETYLSAAYFHEFSQTAQFFTTSAKNRRVITEQLADLSLATSLQEKTVLPLKEAKQQLVKLEAQLSSNSSKFEYKLIQQTDNLRRARSWTSDQQKRREELLEKLAQFDVRQADKLEALLRKQQDYMNQATNLPVCSECGAPKKANHIHKIVDPYQGQIDMVLATTNNYQEQIDRLDKETNPFDDLQEEAKITLAVLEGEEATLTRLINETRTKILDLELLKQSLEVHRNRVLSDNIDNLQTRSNDLLSRYFDAEIRIELSAEGADKLEVLITKDGNQAAYTQLSKGQRQILKLCFAVAVMEAVSNQKGVHMDQLFFDEALSGMDDNIKAKAFALLESLSLTHSDVFCVEHSEGMKQLFSSTISVSLDNGNSTLCQN